jgi:protein-S-isoprenylcysteine O-methyltransferase Ste14
MSFPHRSAVVAWACWSLAFLASAAHAPRLVVDVATVSPRLLPLAGAIALFIAIVAWLQREMGLALARSSFGAPQTLVTSGPFAYSRNPIYLAFAIPLASLALYSIPGALFGLALYFAAMTILVVRPEERDLARAFGPAFGAYAARTPRWIGMPRDPAA